MIQPLQLQPRELNLAGIGQVRGLDRWYTLEGSFTSKASSYGNRLVQREQRALQPAKILSAGGKLPMCIFVQVVIADQTSS